MKALLDSQQQSFTKLRNNKCGALFMEAGTGKTRATIDLVHHAKPDYCLWFTPYQTKGNLIAEQNKWGGIDCDIVGTESISNSDRIYLDLYNKVQQAKAPFIVVDESLKIKNIKAKRTKRILELGKMAESRMILNGTPLSRNLLDLYAQMQFLSPLILRMDEAEFKNTFCEYVQVTYSSPGKQRSYTKEFIKKYHNLEYLYSLIEPYIFESKLSLSVGQQHIDLSFTLTEDEMQEHNALKEKYLDNEVLMAMNNNIFLELTQKMQHNYSLSPEKFKLVDAILEDVNPDKVLIYAKYIETQETLKKYYKGIQIMSLGKHSYGLNLQDYNTIVFWDKTWDYAQREQTERRVFRQGQTSECTYYDLTSNAGLCRLINQNITKKQDMLNYFKKLSAKELKEIL